jgi:ribosome maturation factor RimP
VTGDRKQDRYALAQRVISLVEAELAAEGFELLDVQVFRGGGRTQLRLYVDRNEGVGLDDCARASRTAGMLIEEADLIPHAYVIEVSSPGVRRPLRTPEHFAAAVGQNVELKISESGKPRTLRGKLVACRPPQLILEQAAQADEPPGRREIAFAQLLEAKLDPEFDAQALIGADRRRRKEAKRARRAARRSKPKK